MPKQSVCLILIKRSRSEQWSHSADQKFIQWGHIQAEGIQLICFFQSIKTLTSKAKAQLNEKNSLSLREAIVLCFIKHPWNCALYFSTRNLGHSLRTTEDFCKWHYSPKCSSMCVLAGMWSPMNMWGRVRSLQKRGIGTPLQSVEIFCGIQSIFFTNF